MRLPLFNEILDHHPAVQDDSRGPSFTRHAHTSVAETLHASGVVMLRHALPAAILPACRLGFAEYVRHLERDPEGSWHRPWSIVCHSHRPALAILSSLIRSWTWNVVEEICGSTDITILLSLCTARHVVDSPLPVGAHQDGTAVAPEIPFALWIPLEAVVPRRNAGLGFISPAPEHLLPASPHNDIGSDYVLANLDRTWIPTYAPGDLSVHSSLSPHFTTGYGTRSDRYSLEVRAMASDTAPLSYQDPAIYVARRHDMPSVVGTRCSADSDARHFLSLMA